MAAKTLTVPQSQKDERGGGRLFSFMNLRAWGSLEIGIIMGWWNVSPSSDKSLTLWVGTGFMVGRGFI
ncbi:hypothetical protein, partial [Paenibacillus sp. GbtcB18]|uniref:hypothetical protein n=1 Tax=Paenibacillus sp. GbtcB18 TaxID=2824763 RepID=UPI001C3086E7